MDFQAGIISLYIDFLELCINIKRVSGEMELAQKEMASKPSRNNLHRKNLVSCLCALARRFQYLKRRHTFGRTSIEINAMSRLCDVMAQLLCVALEGVVSGFYYFVYFEYLVHCCIHILIKVAAIEYKQCGETIFKSSIY